MGEGENPSPYQQLTIGGNNKYSLGINIPREFLLTREGKKLQIVISK